MKAKALPWLFESLLQLHFNSVLYDYFVYKHPLNIFIIFLVNLQAYYIRKLLKRQWNGFLPG